jgi:hypothetical protein
MKTPIYNGLPVHEDEAIDLVCETIQSLDGSSGTIADVTRAIAGDVHADRDARGPTRIYGRVRDTLLQALKAGRVEHVGQRWTLARGKRRKAS